LYVLLGSHVRDVVADVGELDPAADPVELAARSGDTAAAESYVRESLAEARRLPELSAAVAALPANVADLLHADGQRDAAMIHLKEAARRFASVDVGDAPRPEIWTLVEW
jgi:hypothetical protein